MHIKADYLAENNRKSSQLHPSGFSKSYKREYKDPFVREKSKKYLLEGLLLKLHRLDKSETLVHLKMVGKISALLSRKLGYSEYKVKKIEFFAKLHDIGKIGIASKIINKPGKLTEDEFEKIKGHTEIGYSLIKRFDFSKIGENIIRYHHEKWNGKGYMGLSKDEIPLEARIVAIADVYDALRMKRSYKEAFTHEKTMEIISEEKGSHFDPRLVEIFMNNNQEIKAIYSAFQN